MTKKRNLFFLIIIIFLLASSGCALVYNPATGRKEIVIINTAQEVELGRNVDKQIRQEYKISTDQNLKERLEKIAKKVAQYSDRQDLEYHFEIIEKEELNAFAAPGGFIYVHTATMNEASDDELACILGHEIGHVAARHPAKKFEAQYGIQIGFLIIGAASKRVDSRVINTLINQIMLGYSREDERFADKLGIKYAYQADFAPEGMISFFNKLLKIEQNQLQMPIFMRSHPYVSERIENAKEEIKKLKDKDVIDKSTSSMPTNTNDKNSIDTTTDNSNSNNNTTTSQPGFCNLCNKTYPSDIN